MQELGDVTIWTIGDDNGAFGDIEDPSYLEQENSLNDRKKSRVKYLDRLIKSVARMARIDVKRRSPDYVTCEERKTKSQSESRKRRRRSAASPIRVMSVPSTCSDDSDVSLPTSESDIDDLLHGSYLQESRAFTAFPHDRIGGYYDYDRPRVLGRRYQKQQYKDIRCPSSSKLPSSSNLKQVSKSMAEIIRDLDTKHSKHSKDFRSYEPNELYRHKRRECNYQMMSESSCSEASMLSSSSSTSSLNYHDTKNIVEHIYESINSDHLYSEVLPVRPPQLPSRPIPGSNKKPVKQVNNEHRPRKTPKLNRTLPFTVIPDLVDNCLQSDSTLDLSRMRVPESYHDFTVDDVLASIQRIEQSDLTVLENEDGEEDIPWDSFQCNRLATFC